MRYLVWCKDPSALGQSVPLNIGMSVSKLRVNANVSNARFTLYYKFLTMFSLAGAEQRGDFFTKGHQALF